MNKIKFNLISILQGVIILLPVIFLLLMIIFNQTVKTDIGGSTNTASVYLYFFIGSLVVALISYAPLKKMHEKAMLQAQYDENGNSIRYKFGNMTKAEREEMDRQVAQKREQILPSSVLKSITKTGSKNPEKELNELIGLTAVRQKIDELNARMELEKGMKHKNDSYFSGQHFVFYGSAGTGKTTVARILTGLLYKNGIIKKNKLIEINGGFLKAGEYSEEKTQMIIREAYDGVLFIDEAYAILDGNSAYGKAVVSTLIKEMEDNRDKFICIFAGYKDDMKRLISVNEGFQSRIKHYIEFEDYNIVDLKTIFMMMANNMNFTVEAEALDNFEIRIAKEKKLPSFANGRTVRTIVDETINRHALRLQKKDIPSGEKYIITAEDVSIHIDDKRF